MGTCQFHPLSLHCEVFRLLPHPIERYELFSERGARRGRFRLPPNERGRLLALAVATTGETEVDRCVRVGTFVHQQGNEIA